MGGIILYNDEYLRITIENNNVMAETFKKGFPMDRIATILSAHPEIGLTNFSTLRTQLISAPSKLQKIGELKEKIYLEISSDTLTASVTFNLSGEELSRTSKQKLRNDLISLLNNNGVIFGVDLSFINEELIPGRPYIAARGTPAVDGSDAVIKMYELLQAKPEVGEGGKVDFYEMKLINRVKAGDWLGERIEATDGIPGKTVKGEDIKPVKGKTAVLNYDRVSVCEVRSPGKTTLTSKINGAVNYSNGKISVSNHLEIDGDAGIATGNIKFDGYVTIKGSINDGFSVEATKDIEINGRYGLGNIGNLVSTGGSIFVKGGVSSRDRVEIRAAKSIYVKFADNAKLVCEETAHIGYYSINSDIIAKNIIFDSSNGKVIGGYLKSEIRISVPICGSDMERRTTLEVTGFNRQALVRRLDEVFHEISIKKAEQQNLKMQSSSPSVHGSSSIDLYDKLSETRDQIKSLEMERKQIAVYLKTKGDGEISITRKLYPNCCIILGGIFAEIKPDVITQTFYIKDGQINMI